MRATRTESKAGQRGKTAATTRVDRDGQLEYPPPPRFLQHCGCLWANQHGFIHLRGHDFRSSHFLSLDNAISLQFSSLPLPPPLAPPQQ
ncbi:hypothetical protein E2C01_033901 [Portunus trituberculatus]|uniref:Uncharacterized protein n=1 Tax=Portunus trituberculatus TaxID=210409 RepID=A0A5B7F3Z3_PORTR|nr:hypothetical protein [Portunus trituberculatus]